MSLDLPNVAGIGATRGLNNEFNATDNRGLALKLFSGTVLEAFRAKTVFYDNTGSIMQKKTIEGGSSYQWPVIGDDIDLSLLGTFDDNSDGGSDNDDFSNPGDVVKDGTGLRMGYHNPGDFITGSKIKMSEQIVRVDDILVSALDVPFIDLDLAHFDMLKPYATKIGRALAIDNDKKIATIGVNAARTAASAGIHAGGTEIVINVAGTPASVADAFSDNSSTATGSGLFRAKVAEMARLMDEKHLPEEGRYLFVPPAIRQLLRHEGTGFGMAGTPASGALAAEYGPGGNPFSKDQNSQPWDLNSRSIGMLEGFNVVISTHLPDGKTSSKYKGVDTNFAKYDYTCDGSGAAAGRIAALALCGGGEGSSPIGMVQAGGVQTVVEDDHRRNVKFMKSQMLVGYDVLCPWTAGCISVH